MSLALEWIDLGRNGVVLAILYISDWYERALKEFGKAWMAQRGLWL